MGNHVFSKLAQYVHVLPLTWHPYQRASTACTCTNFDMIALHTDVHVF